MVAFLIKKFVRDPENVNDPAVRQSYGTVCGLCGIGINVLLFLLKLVAGLAGGSIAIVADAFNNLSDAGASIVTLVGFRLAAQAPDRDHPFGHGRFEYISGMLVSLTIIIMGLSLGRGAIEKVFRPEPVRAGAATVAVLAAAVGLKLYMASYNGKYGKKLGSSAMRATAADSLGDCAATGVVLVATLIGKFTSFNVDGLAGTAVAAFIVWVGIKNLNETVSPLLGKGPDRDFVEKIEEIVGRHPEAKGFHDLAVHDYGPGRSLVSLHVEVDGEENIYELHEVIDDIEHEIGRALGCEAVIHMDPLPPDEKSPVSLRAEVSRLIKERVDERITIHDFSVEPLASGAALRFDSVIPPELSRRSGEIKAKIENLVSESFENCYAVVRIDISLR